MTEHLLELSWRELPMSQNKKLHHMAVHRERGIIINEVLVRSRAAKLPTNLDRVHVELHWMPAVIRSRDTDNPAPSVKALIDGLVRYGLVPDDNSHHVSSETVIHEAKLGSVVKFWVRILEL